MRSSPGWRYATGTETAVAVYPVNGTGDLSMEGYGQLLPAALALDEFRVVNFMTASVYGSLNAETEAEMKKRVEEGSRYDIHKAEFLADRFQASSVDLGAYSVTDLWKDPQYWSVLRETAVKTTQEDIRDQSPVPSWFAKKTLEATSWLHHLRDIGYPVTPSVISECAGLNSADMYLLLQIAEAVTSTEDTILGLAAEQRFHDFIERYWETPSFRRTGPTVNLDGDEIDPPYLKTTADEPQIRITDDTDVIASKLAGASDAAKSQFKRIARSLDQDIWNTISQQYPCKISQDSTQP